MAMAPPVCLSDLSAGHYMDAQQIMHYQPDIVRDVMRLFFASTMQSTYRSGCAFRDACHVAVPFYIKVPAILH
jgi:hypothetical protein